MQIATANPFSILSSKKVRHEPPKEKSKDTKPNQRKEPAKKNESKKAEVKKEEPPKNAKVVSLADAVPSEEAQKALVKEQEKLDKEAKRERDRTDKHDRSGKAHQVRKEGKGVGGWDDNKVETEVAQEVVAEEVEDGKDEAKKDKEDKKEKSPEELAAEAKAKEEEAKQRELEEKQMTLEEYQEKLKKENAPPTAAFNVRTVDDSGFKGMVAKGKEKGDKKFTIGVQPKPKAATPAAPKKEEKEKKEEKKEKVQVDVGFRMENPARQQGKGKGEGKGKGGGRGRGGYSAQPKEDVAPPVDDETAFPALG